MNPPPNDETTDSEPWYRASFDADYLERYAHRDEDEAAAAVALLCRHAKLPRGATLLDLCCGAGRHLVPLRGCGCSASTVIGGDLSHPLLQSARRNTPGFPLLRLDMRHLPFQDASLDLVANFFTAFGYFQDDEENFGVFEEVARVLRPGGWFLLDFLNGETARRQVLDSPPEETQTLPGGDVWLIRRGLSADGLRAEKLQIKTAGRDAGRQLQESVRLFTEPELRNALSQRGLSVAHTFGDYGGAAFLGESSPRAIFLAIRSGK